MAAPQGHSSAPAYTTSSSTHINDFERGPSADSSFVDIVGYGIEWDRGTALEGYERYWCVGPRRTIRGIWLVPLCEILNSQLKQYFRHPRPGWIAKYPVKLRQWSAEYSFPSSDMQLVASGCSFLFGDDHPESVALVIFIVGINRLFAGAHYIHDVLAGTVVGLVLTEVYVLFDIYGNFIDPCLRHFRFGLIILSLPICAMQWYLHAQAGAYIDPKEWEEKANRGRRKKYALNCREAHLKQFTGMYGLFVFLVYFMPLESHALPLPTTNFEFYVRVLIGQPLVVTGFLVIMILSPPRPASIMHLGRALRFGSVPFTVFCLAPSIFGYLC